MEGHSHPTRTIQGTSGLLEGRKQPKDLRTGYFPLSGGQAQKEKHGEQIQRRTLSLRTGGSESGPGRQAADVQNRLKLSPPV